MIYEMIKSTPHGGVNPAFIIYDYEYDKGPLAFVSPRAHPIALFLPYELYSKPGYYQDRYIHETIGHELSHVLSYRNRIGFPTLASPTGYAEDIDDLLSDMRYLVMPNPGGSEDFDFKYLAIEFNDMGHLHRLDPYTSNNLLIRQGIPPVTNYSNIDFYNFLSEFHDTDEQLFSAVMPEHILTNLENFPFDQQGFYKAHFKSVSYSPRKTSLHGGFNYPNSNTINAIASISAATILGISAYVNRKFIKRHCCR